MKLREDVNEYGTPVGVFRCDTCGDEFTVCPKPRNMDHPGWQNCLARECASYEKSRDADLLFDDPDVPIMKEGIH